MSRMAQFGLQTTAPAPAAPRGRRSRYARPQRSVHRGVSGGVDFVSSLSGPVEPPQAVAEGGELANQLGFSTMFLAFAAWTYCHEPRRLLLLVRPVLIAVVAWCVLSVIASWEPALAARRLAFALVVMSISAMVLLLPKNLRQFSDLMATAVLIVLAACYLGVFLLPQYAIHHATDFLEPEHAGNWRGVFPHKNDAGATMVLFIFIGFYVARMRSFALGGMIVVLSAIFLAFSQSKTAIGVLPLALLLAGDHRPHAAGPALGIGLVVTHPARLQSVSPSVRCYSNRCAS